ncbi:cytochrome C biogenesis protein, partial [bacterium M00.F.Ca.ET.228.01.1.1]
DGICYPPMTRRVKLSIPAGKLSTGSDPAPARTAMVSPLPAAGAPRESADGAPLRLLPTVPNENAAATAAGSATPGTAFANDARGDNALRTRPPVTTP